MGEISDYYTRREQFGEIPSDCSTPKSYTKWRMGNGDLIKLKDMTSLHITNCIKRIKSNSWKMDWLEPMEKELKSRNT